MLRYVRRRFYAERETRRRLAEERRDVLRQSCTRLETVLALATERDVMLNRMRASEEIAAQRATVYASIAIEEEERRQAEGQVESIVEMVLSDIIFEVEMSEQGHISPPLPPRTPPPAPPSSSSISSMSDSGFLPPLLPPPPPSRAGTPFDGMREFPDFVRAADVAARDAEHDAAGIAASREAAQARELSIMNEEAEKLEGEAGQWLADNQVQQAEDQLALTRSALEDVKAMAEARAEELRAEIRDGKELLEIAETTTRAERAMFQNEIKARRQAASLAIEHLQNLVEETRRAMENLRKEKDGEIMRMAEEHAIKLAKLTAELEEAQNLAITREKWVNSLQVQAALMRQQAENAAMKHARRWRHGSASGRPHEAGSLPCDAERTEEELGRVEEGNCWTEKGEGLLRSEMHEKEREHRSDMKEMRWQVWQRGKTARRPVQTLTVPSRGFWRVLRSRWLGKQHNERISSNGGVRVLLSFSTLRRASTTLFDRWRRLLPPCHGTVMWISA